MEIGIGLNHGFNGLNHEFNGFLVFSKKNLGFYPALSARDPPQAEQWQ